MIYKVQSLLAPSVSYDVVGVRSAKMTEVFGGNDHSLDAACLDFTRSESAALDPGFNLDRGNVKRNR